MKLYSAEVGPIGTCTYLFVEEDTNKAAIVDAAPDSYATWEKIIEENNLKLEAILLTHTHWDHSADTQLFKEKYGSKVYVSKLDEYRLIAPNDHSIWKLPFEIKPAKADYYTEDVPAFKIGNLEIDVIHTPGHTEGGVCFKIEKERVIFTGDTLFNEGIGRSDLPGGDGELLFQSIREQLYTLADDFTIYPGHGMSSELGYEKYNNPYIRKD